MSESPLLELTSHIGGKNAKVRVFADRLEWERGKSMSGGKVTAGILTAGLSLAATGLRTRKGAGVEVIPIRQVTSVTSRRDSVLNDSVSVVAAGNTVDFRVSRSEGERLRSLLLDLINRAHAPAAPTGPAPAAGEDPIARLAGLHAAGHLTDAEFAAAKARELGL